MKLRHRALVVAGLAVPAACAPTAHRGHAPDQSAVSTPLPETAAGPGPAEEPAPSAGGPATTSAEPVAPASGSAGASTTVTTVIVSTTSTVATPAAAIAVPVPAAAAVEVLPEFENEGLTDEEWWEAQPGHQEPARDVLLACIRSYEQGGAGYATDTGNGFYGAYQFDLPTWRSVGGAGNPAHASAAEQDARAWALYQSRGLAPWPTPARRCG